MGKTKLSREPAIQPDNRDDRAARVREVAADLEVIRERDPDGYAALMRLLVRLAAYGWVVMAA